MLLQRSEGGALGIGVGDRVYMLENTWYTVISPESCSSILWRSWDQKEKDNDYSYVREKVQGQCAQVLFIQFKPFNEPRRVGMPQD